MSIGIRTVEIRMEVLSKSVTDGWVFTCDEEWNEGNRFVVKETFDEFLVLEVVIVADDEYDVGGDELLSDLTEVPKGGRTLFTFANVVNANDVGDVVGSNGVVLEFEKWAVSIRRLIGRFGDVLVDVLVDVVHVVSMLIVVGGLGVVTMSGLVVDCLVVNVFVLLETVLQGTIDFGLAIVEALMISRAILQAKMVPNIMFERWVAYGGLSTGVELGMDGFWDWTRVRKRLDSRVCRHLGHGNCRMLMIIRLGHLPSTVVVDGRWKGRLPGMGIHAGVFRSHGGDVLHVAWMKRLEVVRCLDVGDGCRRNRFGLEEACARAVNVGLSHGSRGGVIDGRSYHVRKWVMASRWLRTQRMKEVVGVGESHLPRCGDLQQRVISSVDERSSVKIHGSIDDRSKG